MKNVTQVSVSKTLARCISRGAGWTAATALVILAGGCSKPVAKRAFSAAQVKTEVIQTTNIPETSEYLSTLKSRRSAAINPQVEGWITQIYAHSGEHVRQGQPLVAIDPRVQEATLNSQIAARNAQAATLANAKTQFERAQKLYQAGIVSKQEFDNAQTAYEAAEAQTKAMDAQVTQQQAQLHYYNVTSPTDGIVGDIPVHVGDRVTNTTLLTTVDQPGSLEAYIYSRWIRRIPCELVSRSNCSTTPEKWLREAQSRSSLLK